MRHGVHWRGRDGRAGGRRGYLYEVTVVVRRVGGGLGGEGGGLGARGRGCIWVEVKAGLEGRKVETVLRG